MDVQIAAAAAVQVRDALVDAPDVEQIYVIEHEGKIVSTASARIMPVEYPGSGYLHWGDAQLTHQNFYLGPTNELLHGRTMLVDMFSQYGVGVMYFLAGIFSVVPIGYGTFSIVNSALFALEIVALYAVVRLATRSQLLAVSTAASW